MLWIQRESPQIVWRRFANAPAEITRQESRQKSTITDLDGPVN